MLQQGHGLEGEGNQSGQDSFGADKSQRQTRLKKNTTHPLVAQLRDEREEDVWTQDGVYNPDHGDEKDHVLTATLQAVLELAGTISMDLSTGGQNNSTFSIADVVYSVLPSHPCLFGFCDNARWTLSRIVRNKVVRNCILIELAKHIRSGYLPLFKKPAMWCQDSTTTSQWSIRLAGDSSISMPHQGSGGDLAVFAWLGENPTDDPQALAARRAVTNAIEKGMRHGATSMEASLLTDKGNVLDGQRAVLENIDYSTAQLKAPNLACIVSLVTTQSPLRLPARMATFLRDVKSMDTLDSVVTDSMLAAHASSSISRVGGSSTRTRGSNDGPPAVPSIASFSIPTAMEFMKQRMLRTPQGVLHCDGVLANTAFALLDLAKEPSKDTTVYVWPGRSPTSYCPR